MEPRKYFVLAVFAALSASLTDARAAEGEPAPPEERMEIDLTFLGGLNFDTPRFATEPTGLNAKAGLVYGAEVGVAVNPRWHLEVGILATEKKFNYRDTPNAGDDVDLSYRDYEIPVVFRYVFSPVLSVGVGGYYGLLADQARTKGRIAGAAVDSDAATPNRESSDFGLRGNFRLAFPLGTNVRLVGDFSYNLGMKDIDQSTAGSEKTRELQTLAGFGWML